MISVREVVVKTSRGHRISVLVSASVRSALDTPSAEILVRVEDGGVLPNMSRADAVELSEAIRMVTSPFEFRLHDEEP